MACIFLDRQSRNWKIKTVINGEDKRPPLRKSTPEEFERFLAGERPVPADVVKLATDRGFIATDPTPTPVPIPAVATEKAPDNLLSFLDYFMVEYGKYHRPGSIKRMGGIVKNFRRFLTATENTPKLISQVTNDLIMDWFEWRRVQLDPRLKIPIKPHVVVGETEQLSGLFKLAVEKDKLKYNIAKTELDKLRKAHPKPKPEHQTKYLDPDERRDFLKAIDDSVNDGIVPLDYANLARVMLSTGLRVEAALNMDYAWIGKDWAIKVPPDHDKCKTGYSTVVADLGRTVLVRRRGLQMAGQVFPDHMTQAMSYYYLRRLGITNHMLRHSFATALVDASVPIQVISDLLGHKSISTTQVYAKIRDDAKVKAVGKLNFG